jgi:hypothetical protein
VSRRGQPSSDGYQAGLQVCRVEDSPAVADIKLGRVEDNPAVADIRLDSKFVA